MEMRDSEREEGRWEEKISGREMRQGRLHRLISEE